MDTPSSSLPDSLKVLKEIIVDQRGQISQLQAQYDKQTGILLEEISLLRAQLYGRKSEKHAPVDGPQPLPLFDMPEPEEIDEPEEKISIPAHVRKKKGRKPLPKELPREEVLHDIAEEDKVCGCGCELTRIGEETSEQLDITPAKVKVLRHVRPKYACRNCEGVEDEGPTVKIAPAPPQLIPRSIASPGLLAHILTAKFTDHLPFYRQEQMLTRLGVDISRTSMCRWAMQVATACQPLLNLLSEELVAGDIITVDETPVQVLQEPGRSPTAKSYMWIFRRGDPGKQVLRYHYSETRSTSVVREMLHGFTGFVQSDGYAAYGYLDHEQGVRHIGCWAHARRRFNDIVKAQGKKRKAGAADTGLSYIRQLYALEKRAAAKELSCEAIYEMRQQKARPILDKFHKWLSKKKLQVPPKSLLGKAVSYTLNQWDRLTGYLEDGRLHPDNNLAENAIRPFVVGRKNWLFSGTPEGAEASALLFSLIETAKANNLEPYGYLRHILSRLPLAETLEDYEALLPWNISREQLALPVMVKCC
jgi:transposase